MNKARGGAEVLQFKSTFKISKKFPVQNRALPPLLLRDIKNTRKKSSQHQNARFEREEEEEEEEERGKEGKQGEGSPSFYFLKTHIIHSLFSRIFNNGKQNNCRKRKSFIIIILFKMSAN